MFDDEFNTSKLLECSSLAYQMDNLQQSQLNQTIKSQNTNDLHISIDSVHKDVANNNQDKVQYTLSGDNDPLDKNKFLVDGHDNIRVADQSKQDGIQSIKVDLISHLILDFESKLSSCSSTDTNHKMSISTHQQVSSNNSLNVVMESSSSNVSSTIKSTFSSNNCDGKDYNQSIKYSLKLRREPMTQEMKTMSSSETTKDVTGEFWEKTCKVNVEKPFKLNIRQSVVLHWDNRTINHQCQNDSKNMEKNKEQNKSNLEQNVKQQISEDDEQSILNLMSNEKLISDDGLIQEKKDVGFGIECPICHRHFEKAQSLGGHMSKSHPNQSESYARKMRTRNEREHDRQFVAASKRLICQIYPNIDKKQLKQKTQNMRVKVKKLILQDQALSKMDALHVCIGQAKINMQKV